MSFVGRILFGFYNGLSSRLIRFDVNFSKLINVVVGLVVGMFVGLMSG